MFKTFLERIKSPIVLSGILAAIIQVALLWGLDPAEVELWRGTIVVILGLYETLFVATNNPTNKTGY